MPRIKMLDAGPSKYVSAATGTVRPGETVTVGSAAADTLLEKPFFEPTDDVVLSEDEYSIEDSGEIDYTSIPPKLDDCTYDELYEIASDHDISGRSDMSKDELIEALSE